jgi:hypothetical protein
VRCHENDLDEISASCQLELNVPGKKSRAHTTDTFTRQHLPLAFKSKARAPLFPRQQSRESFSLNLIEQLV